MNFNSLTNEFNKICSKNSECSYCKYHTNKCSCQIAFAFEKGREDAIEEFKFKIKECCSMVGSCDFDDLNRIAKQLKEQNEIL